MEEVMLHVEPRTVTGKAVKQLRSQGLVPAVIHDHGKESLHVAGQYLELLKAYKRAGKHHPVNLKTGDKQFTALIKNADFDPKKHQLRHIVFNAVKANEKVDAEIPVRIRFSEGNDATPAERTGLVVLHQLEAVEVSALPKFLPEVLEFDGEKLAAAGDSVTVADLLVPSNVTVKTDSNHPLATVFEPSALQAANDAAGGTAEEESPAAEAVEGEEAAATELQEAKKEAS
ncbi:MAG TPA: 50S ribosomal protein L25 [Candidatus Saccharimonadales bacterium]|nr:50S ribosomal protein L25 [Candidatus Saccharimonadales bacterium]